MNLNLAESILDTSSTLSSNVYKTHKLSYSLLSKQQKKHVFALVTEMDSVAIINLVDAQCSKIASNMENLIEALCSQVYYSSHLSVI